MQGYASPQLSLILCQQKAAVGWGIVTGKPGEFFVKILKAEVHAQRVGVFQKELPRLGDLRRRLRLHKHEFGDASRYPMSMPPFTFRTCPVI